MEDGRPVARIDGNVVHHTYDIISQTRLELQGTSEMGGCE
jgi:hypothetical protein